MSPLPTTIIKEKALPEGTVTLRSDGIVYVKYYENQTIDVGVQMRMLEVFNEITQKKLTPFIFEADEGVIVTKEARDNGIAIEELTPCKATAVVVSSIGYSMIANFYLKFNKPKRPFKVFSNVEDAQEWLKGYL